MIEFQMPSLGADMEAGILREWYKKPGDLVKRGDIIADVETQKGIIEIEVFDEGKIEKLLIKENDKVPVGTVMALISPLVETAGKIIKTPIVSEQKVIIPEHKEQALVSTAHHIRISPLAKKLAETNGIDYSEIKGSGEEGAIVRADIENLLKGNTAPKGISATEGIRAAIAAAMSKSNKEIPHYYLETKVDMRTALDWLKNKNRSLSVANRILPVALMIKAVALALKEFPELNAVWDKQLIKKEKINIGIVTTLRGGGIIIPAIQQVDTKKLDEIMIALTDIIQRARDMKLRSSELSESTVTITNLGDNSVETVFGVVYPPQVALIGFGSIVDEPWAENGMLDVRPVIHITLAADHRATDGHTGSRFLQALKNLLLDPEKL